MRQFLEKPKGDGQWISGGFMVCEPSVFDRIGGDETIFENEPLASLAKTVNYLYAGMKGSGAAMDTLRDRTYLEDLWAKNAAPWKVWS